MDREIGDWIELNERIYEIVGITNTDYKVREVMYLDTTYLKLKYGGTYFIGKAVVNGGDI